MKELVGLVGLDPRMYATHSLRRGSASGALSSGQAPFFTKYQGGLALRMLHPVLHRVPG